MKKWDELEKELLKDKETRKEFERLAPRYQLISELIKIRIKKGLTQEKLAKQIGTKQSAIARLESGKENISIDSLEKISHAMGAKIKISIS